MFANKDSRVLFDMSNDSSNLKRKLSKDSLNTDEPVKRQNSQNPLEKSPDTHLYSDDRVRSPHYRPDNQRSRSPRSRRYTARTAIRSSYQYSPERSSSRERDDDRSRRDISSRSNSREARRSPNHSTRSLEKTTDPRDSERNRKRQSPVRNGIPVDDRNNVEELAREDRARVAAEYNQYPQKGGSRTNENLSGHGNMYKSSQDVSASASTRYEATSPILQSGATLQKSTSSDRSDAMREFMSLLGQFGENVTDVSSLKIHQASLKKTLDRRVAEYEKASRHFADFPAAAKAQEIAVQRAQKEMDAIEQELKQKQVGYGQIIEQFAERIVPSNLGLESNLYTDLKNRVEAIAENQVAFSSKQHIFTERFDHESKKLSDAQSLWGVTKNNQTQLYKKFDEVISLPLEVQKVHQANHDEMIKLRQEVEAIKAMTLEKTAIKDFNAVHLKVEDISYRLHEIRTDLMGITRSTENKISEVETLKKLIFGDEDLETLKRAVFGAENQQQSMLNLIQILEANVEKFGAALVITRDFVNENQRATENELDTSKAELKKITNRIAAVETRPLTNSGAGEATSSEFVAKLEMEQQILQETQDAVGISLDEVKNMVHQVVTRQGEVSEQFIETRTKTEEIKTALEAHNHHFELLGQDFVNSRNAQKHQQDQQNENLVRVESMVNSVQVDIKNVVSEFQNAVEGLKVGQTNLDSRMHNLSTEALARQMLGQLESVYPNIRNVEQGIVSLRDEFTNQSGQLFNFGVRLDKLEQERSSIAANEGPSKDAFDHISQTVYKMSLDLQESKERFGKEIETLVEKNSPSNIASLVEDIKSQNVENIEDLIEKIGNCQIDVEELKELTKVLERNDNEREQLLVKIKDFIESVEMKSQAMSQTQTAITNPSRTRSTNKRSIGAAGNQSNGQRRRKKGSYGPFDSDEDSSG